MVLFETSLGLMELKYFWEGLGLITFGLIYLAYYLSFREPHFIIRGTYDPKRKNMRKPPPPFPNGWYNVANSK